MGTNNHPKRAAELIQRMKRVQEGDAKHPDRPLPKDVRAKLDAEVTALEAALARSQAGKAEAHEATEAQHAVTHEARLALEAARHFVYALYTNRARTVEDYGLVPRTRHRGKSKDEPQDGKHAKKADKPSTQADSAEPTKPAGEPGK